MWWFTWNWASTQVFVVASGAMHLSGRARAVLAVPVLGTAAAAFHWSQPSGSDLTWIATSFFFYWLAAMTILPAILFGAARLVRALDELYATRVELAQSVAGGERARLSRDLHDLLGQSLTAVSLKGDLALALLSTDRAAAEAEIRSLTMIAREVLHGMRAVKIGEHNVTLRSEAALATRLLQAAGVETCIRVTSTALSPEVDEALAWATREGVTNILRHSQALHCSITAERSHGRVRLEISNDGATNEQRDPATGRGLAGVSERARALYGAATAEHGDDGTFVLRIEVPEATA
jgi:two-component system sensor histidine kinase DesK